MPPAWLTDIFAALMLLVAAVSAARLAVGRPWRRGAVITDTDISHLLMGIAMAGMLASGLATLSNGAWAVIFGVLTAWFAYRVVRDARANGVRALAGGHCAPHLVHSGAMLYMFLAITAMSGGSGMAGMGGSVGGSMQTLRYPTLAFVFAIVLIGYTAWDLDQLPGFGHALALAVPVPAGPALAGATAVVTSAGTGASKADEPAGAPRTDGHSVITGFLLSSEITVGCRIAMGVTMALMLFLMI